MTGKNCSFALMYYIIYNYPNEYLKVKFILVFKSLDARGTVGKYLTYCPSWPLKSSSRMIHVMFNEMSKNTIIQYNNHCIFDKWCLKYIYIYAFIQQTFIKSDNVKISISNKCCYFEL